MLRLLTITWAVLISLPLFAAQPDAPFRFVEAPFDDPAFGLADEREFLPARGRLRTLIVFAQFAEEADQGDQIPLFAERLFDSGVEGSFAHFYDTMSFGQFAVRGQVLRRRYTADRPKRMYLAKKPGQKGRYGQFVADILRQVDAECDLGQFDSDGADGVPNSGDDDGIVDYLFVLVRKVPTDFIKGQATGKVGLALDPAYQTDDRTLAGEPIRVSGAWGRGAILETGTFAQTAGTMAHEFGHSLGLIDLYEWNYTLDAPERDSAGIGKWGLMGWGTLGWNGDDGPNPFCAWSREQLGWIGPDNQRLIEVADDTTGLEIAPLHAGGAIYKIPLDPEYLPSGAYADEYLLLEQRTRAASFYDRSLPGEGLLVWRIRSGYRDNSQEKKKLVDLVCADGLWTDAGHPAGRTPDPREGGDNLDFWAHGSAYQTQHAGNDGDATDPFDGVALARYAPDTNPSSVRASPSAAYTGLEIRMRPRGSRMVVDARLPHWSGFIRERVRWLGDVRVAGDVEIVPEGTLMLYSRARVRFARVDHLATGYDPARCELRVRGILQINPYPPKHQVMTEKRQTEPRPVVFAGQQPGQTWTGILVEEGGNAMLPEGTFVLEDAIHGLLDDPTDLTDLEEAYPTAVTAAENAEIGPEEFTLLPNYPNPFTESTTLPYTLPVSAQVRLTVFNALGQTERVLVDDHRSAGRHEEEWDGRDADGRDVASGLYIAHLEVPGQFAASRKMMRLESGFSHISTLDSLLQAQSGDWAAVSRGLEQTAGPEFGLADALALAQTAFTIGSRWVDLQAGIRAGAKPSTLRGPGRDMVELLTRCDPEPEQSRHIDFAIEQLGLEGIEPQAILEPLRTTVDQLLQDREVAVYFYLGEWLQALRSVSLAAAQLDLPLADVADLPADAGAVRQFAVHLREQDADQSFIDTLQALASLLETEPQSQVLLERIEQLENLVLGR